jgi:YrbI family 3-deoxy-D-manno-octulosonate 8-phosphate phosphatase
VHTDDRAVIDSVGTEMVTVSRSDGMGVGLLRTAGIPLFIVSSEVNPVVAARARKLDVEFRQGRQHKKGSLEKWAKRIGVPLERIAYLGNDVNDLECMAAVGWPIAVADAHPEVRRAARIVLSSRGGHGAVRELADRVLRGRPDHETTIEGEQSWQ